MFGPRGGGGGAPAQQGQQVEWHFSFKPCRSNGISHVISEHVEAVSRPSIMAAAAASLSATQQWKYIAAGDLVHCTKTSAPCRNGKMCA